MNATQMSFPDQNHITAAYARIREHIRRTPILEMHGADFALAAFPLFLKLELLQHTGSFKARGAVTNLMFRDVPPAGVVAASGGNHGVAVAFAAKKFNVRGAHFCAQCLPGCETPTHPGLWRQPGDRRRPLRRCARSQQSLGSGIRSDADSRV